MKSRISSDFWRGKRVFITGHTGFKGSWLSLWLQSMGAKVTGFSLTPPTSPSLFLEANIADGMVSVIGDIRDFDALNKALINCQPEILIHMAAQPLVRESYRDPVSTYATNVMGTVHVFEAARKCSSLRAIVNVTTDKCYENREWVWGYRENEPMGGHDPYSNSKGCSELVTAAFRNSYFGDVGTAAVASARAGNVIGGGDWAAERLVPDALLAFEQGRPVVIRNPTATRPWQHVLEPLSGYLILAEHLHTHGEAFAQAWNFGPRDEDVLSVESVLNLLVSGWGDGATWTLEKEAQLHEATLLKLDISKAISQLGWHPVWSVSQAVSHILEWHQCWLSGGDVKVKMLEQIQRYESN